VRRALVVLLVAALAGCGGQQHGHGTATLWITRDRGSEVLLTTTVPAGETAMRALERVTKVKTTYGGRYVQGMRGSEGSLTGGRDWFYFVNGIAADVSAAEYRLHPGDVEWWDYRSWKGSPDVTVVVGAFPEPFLHGYRGKVRPAVVIGPGAAALARLLHARVAAAAPRGVNVFRVVSGAPRFTARTLPGGGVEFDFAGDPRALARDPARYRFRYEVRP
jgi:hypothetical protein